MPCVLQFVLPQAIFISVSPFLVEYTNNLCQLYLLTFTSNLIPFFLIEVIILVLIDSKDHVNRTFFHL